MNADSIIVGIAETIGFFSTFPMFGAFVIAPLFLLMLFGFGYFWRVILTLLLIVGGVVGLGVFIYLLKQWAHQIEQVVHQSAYYHEHYGFFQALTAVILVVFISCWAIILFKTRTKKVTAAPENIQAGELRSARSSPPPLRPEWRLKSPAVLTLTKGPGYSERRDPS